MNENYELQKALNDINKKDLMLEATARCIWMVRESRAKGLGDDLTIHLFKLAEKMARMEWGSNTTSDDFSEPGFFIVSNGKKSKRL